MNTMTRIRIYGESTTAVVGFQAIEQTSHEVAA